MGCLKLPYYEEEGLDIFRKNLKVVYAKSGATEKKGLNYSTFGMTMPGGYDANNDGDYDDAILGDRKPRSFSGEYRYGHNGKEKTDEVSGNGNVYDYGFRIYNPRLGRFLSVDPLAKKFAMLTPYQFASNSPVRGIDIDGLEYGDAIKKFIEDQLRTVLQEATEEIIKGLANIIVQEIHDAIEQGKLEAIKKIEDSSGKKIDLSKTGLETIELSGNISGSFGVGNISVGIGISEGGGGEKGKDFIVGTFITGKIEIDDGLIKKGLSGFNVKDFEAGLQGRIKVGLKFSDFDEVSGDRGKTSTSTKLGVSGNILGNGFSLSISTPNDKNDNSFSLAGSINFGVNVKKPLSVKVSQVFKFKGSSKVNLSQISVRDFKLE